MTLLSIALAPLTRAVSPTGEAKNRGLKVSRPGPGPVTPAGDRSVTAQDAASLAPALEALEEAGTPILLWCKDPSKG